MKSILVILSSVLFILCGCSTSVETRSDGTKIFNTNEGVHYTYENPPCKIQIDEKTMQVEDVRFYQDKTEHGYNLYAIMTVDTSELSEDDIYWIDKDYLMEIYLDIDSEKNNYDSEEMSKISHLDSNNERIIAYRLLGESRYSFEDANYEIFAHARQSEKFTKNGEESNKLNIYRLPDVKVSDGEPIPSSDEIEPEIREIMSSCFD